MGSIHQQPGRPYLFCSFLGEDGRWKFRSTKVKNRKEAQKICDTWEHAARIARAGKLTPDRAREIIQEGIAAIFEGTGDALPSSSIRNWCMKWLESVELRAGRDTHTRYKYEINRLLQALGSKADRDLVTLRASDIADLRDRIAKTLSRATAIVFLKVIRTCFQSAVKRGILTSNPASRVESIKMTKESRRRPFSGGELGRIIQQAKGTEWEGLILASLYCGGARLGDVARLTWRNIDLEKGVAAFTTRKTGRRQLIPLHPVLQRYFENLPSSDKLDDPLFPQAFSAVQKRVGTLSNQFHDLLVDVGLADRRSHEIINKGRNAARETFTLSFHSLRHTATTMLKAAGVSDVIARELVGHDSIAVSKSYTHLGEEHLRPAIKLLPDVTK